LAFQLQSNFAVNDAELDLSELNKDQSDALNKDLLSLNMQPRSNEYVTKT